MPRHAGTKNDVLKWLLKNRHFPAPEGKVSPAAEDVQANPAVTVRSLNPKCRRRTGCGGVRRCGRTRCGGCGRPAESAVTETPAAETPAEEAAAERISGEEAAPRAKRAGSSLPPGRRLRNRRRTRPGTCRWTLPMRRLRSRRRMPGWRSRARRPRRSRGGTRRRSPREDKFARKRQGGVGGPVRPDARRAARAVDPPGCGGVEDRLYRIRRAEVEAARRRFVEEGGAEGDFARFGGRRRNPAQGASSRSTAVAATRSSPTSKPRKEANLKVKQAIIEELKELVNSGRDAQPYVQQVPRVAAALEGYRHRAAAACQGFVGDLQSARREFLQLHQDQQGAARPRSEEELRTEGSPLRAGRGAGAGAFRRRGVPQAAKLHDEWRETGPVANEYKEALWGAFQSCVEPHQQTASRAFRNAEGRAGEEPRTQDRAVRRHGRNFRPSRSPPARSGTARATVCWRFRRPGRPSVFAPKKITTRIYERFRTACDRFFEAKRQFYAGMKTEMEHNLQLKIEICEAAESLMNSEEWKKATDELIALQARWKQIGAVSRRHSDAVWKRFRAACDKVLRAQGVALRERRRRARGEPAEETRPAGRNGRGRREGRGATR